MTKIENILLNIITAIVTIIGIVFVIVIYNLFYYQKLNSYLKKKKPRRLSELLKYRTFAEATSNPIRGINYAFRFLDYLYNDLDIRDKNIRKYKFKLRLGFKLFLLSIFVVFALLSITIMIAWFFGGFS
jgi:cell division protein FtsL